MTADVIACARAEFTRLRKWPAFWIMLGTWIVLNLVWLSVQLSGLHIRQWGPDVERSAA